jgi:hypothetical protein
VIAGLACKVVVVSLLRIRVSTARWRPISSEPLSPPVENEAVHTDA